MHDALINIILHKFNAFHKHKFSLCYTDSGSSSSRYTPYRMYTYYVVFDWNMRNRTRNLQWTTNCTSKLWKNTKQNDKFLYSNLPFLFRYAIGVGVTVYQRKSIRKSISLKLSNALKSKCVSILGNAIRIRTRVDCLTQNVNARVLHYGVTSIIYIFIIYR